MNPLERGVEKSPQACELNHEFQLSALRRAELPCEVREHPLVRNALFYTLPSKFWTVVGNDLVAKRCDADLIALEYQLAVLAEKVGPNCVGFCNGHPMIDDLLRPIDPIDALDESQSNYFHALGWDDDRIKKFCIVAARRADLLNKPRRAYLGWLFTDARFIDEFNAFKQAYPSLIPPAGKPPISLMVPPAGLPDFLRPSQVPDRSASAYWTFCQRWRLQTISGPHTVQPIGAQIPATVPALSAEHAQFSGAMIYLPDIFPLPDRDELRLFLEDSIRETAKNSEHLAEWVELTLADTKGKRMIETYSRCYPFQHYLRVVYSRHGDRLRRGLSRVLTTLGSVLSRSAESIRRDMWAINRRLKPNWFLP